MYTPRQSNLAAFVLVLFWASAGHAHGPTFTLTGRAAERLLLGPGAADRPRLAAMVRSQGFYADAAGAGEVALGAGPCGDCHADVAAQWAGSAHHFSSFNNPFYRVAFEMFAQERGPVASRFCAGCHDPVMFASGALDGSAPLARPAQTRPAAQAGIVCLVCHSIDSTSLSGNGVYHATLAPVPAKAPAHGARLRPALLGKTELCATCHKVGLDQDITADHWLRGQDDYDPWLASAAAGNGAAAIWRAKEARCQDCHMPDEPVHLGDAGAKPGPDGTLRIRSHRFLGGNSALPALRGDQDALAREQAFLAGKVSLDVRARPIESGASSGDERFVDIVLRSRGIAHRFPGGTMDSNQVWLAVTALDPNGQVIAESGHDRGGQIDGDVHLLRAQPVDGEGRPLERRDPQHMRGVVYDTALLPTDPQVVRYAVPAAAASLHVRLLYRKFTPDYARLACGDIPDPAVRDRCQALPVVEVAQVQTPLPPPGPPGMMCPPQALPGQGSDAVWQGFVDHGLGLAQALAEHASEAIPVLECARQLAPARPEPLLGLARVALQLGQADQAVMQAQAAQTLAPDHPAAQWLQALALYRAYRFAEARAPAEALAAALPRDPNGLWLLGRVRGVTGDAAGTLQAADRLLALDPDSAEGHYQRALALRELGRASEADQAEASYLHYRATPEVDLALKARFRALYPGRAEEDIPLHVHHLHRIR